MTKITLGLTKSAGVLLNLHDGSTSNSNPPVPCYRFICEDSILFIPAKGKQSVARALGETSLLAIGAAGGLMTVAALAPIIAAHSVINRSKIESQLELRLTAEILAHQDKTIEDCIIFPVTEIADLEVEKQSFSLLLVNKNPFKISIDGSASVYGTHHERLKGFWTESNEIKGDQLYALLKTLTVKTRYGSGGGVTLFWKDD